MSNLVRKTIMIVAVAAVTVVGTASAYAQQDPTQGRLNQRLSRTPEDSAKLAKYHKCVNIGRRFLRQCVETSNGNQNRINSCYVDYKRARGGCAATYL